MWIHLEVNAVSLQDESSCAEREVDSNSQKDHKALKIILGLLKYAVTLFIALYKKIYVAVLLIHVHL